MTIWLQRIHLALEYPSAIKPSFAVMYINIIVLLPYYSKQSSLNFFKQYSNVFVGTVKNIVKNPAFASLKFGVLFLSCWYS